MNGTDRWGIRWLTSSKTWNAWPKLLDEGKLTPDEYEQMKRELLESPSTQSEPADPMARKPPGWYNDPTGKHQHQAFWDGQKWTETTRPTPEMAPPSAAQRAGAFMGKKMPGLDYALPTPKAEKQQRKPMSKWLLLVIAIVILIAVANLGGGGSSRSGNTPPPTQAASPAQRYVNEYGGQLAAYNRILGMTDCDGLQEQFDIAGDNNDREEPGTAAFKWTLGYMTAADDRMEAVGCYG